MIPPDEPDTGGDANEAPKTPAGGKKLTKAERAALGEPPGKKAREKVLRAKREAEAVNRIESDLEEVEGYRMPLIEHLVELRDRIVKAMAALIIGLIVSLYFASDLYAFLTRPFLDAVSSLEGVQGGLALVNSPFEGFYTYLKVGVVGGAVFAMPVISWQVWQFVAPGLYRTERKIVAPLAIASTILFFIGSGFCYYVIFDYAFPFFLQILDADVNLSVEGYLTAVVRMMLAFGLCFQMPVASMFLARIGMIDHVDLAKAFRYAIVVIFFIAALITPPDPVTQSLLAAPLILLYGISIAIAWMFTTKDRAALEAFEKEFENEFTT